MFAERRRESLKFQGGNRRWLVKWFVCAFCAFVLAFDVRAGDDVSSEITALLKEKNVDAEVVFLLDKNLGFIDKLWDGVYKKEYSGKNYDMSYVNRMRKSDEYLDSYQKPLPRYDDIYGYLPNFVNLLFNGERMKLDLKDVRELILAIADIEIKQIVVGVPPEAEKRYAAHIRVVPWERSYAIAEGILIVLFKNGRPVFAFDIKSPEHFLIPYDSREETRRFYRFHFDDKGRLFMFDSYLYRVNDKINRLSAKLWRKLDIGVVVRMKKYYELPVDVVDFYSYVPRKGAGDTKLCDVDKFPEIYYNSIINRRKAQILKWTNDIKKLEEEKAEAVGKEADKLQWEIDNFKRRIPDAKAKIPRYQKLIKEIKVEIQKRKKLYESLEKSPTD